MEARDGRDGRDGLSRLTEGLATLGIDASDAQLEQTLEWLNLIARWNDVCGLTSIRDLPGRLDKLVLDSLAARPFLRPGRVLDVGSGAGAPGIALAIFEPQNNYTLVDAVMKKAQFLERCARDLNLAHVDARHCRVEQLKAPPTYDTIIARGVGGADRIVRAASCLAKPTTRWIFFRSAGARKETLPTGERWRIEYANAPCERKTLSLMILERDA